MGKDGVPLPGQFFEGEEPTPDAGTPSSAQPANLDPRRGAPPPPPSARRVDPIRKDEGAHEPQSRSLWAGFIDGIKSTFGPTSHNTNPPPEKGKEPVASVSTRVTERVEEALSAQAETPVAPPPPSPSPVAPKPAPSLAPEKKEEVQFTENERAVLANTSIPEEIRAIYKDKIDRIAKAGKAGREAKDYLEGLASNPTMIDFFETIAKVAEELTSLYEELERQTPRPSREWLDEAKHRLEVFEWDKRTQRVLQDIRDLKERDTLTPRPELIDDWKSRSIYLAPDKGYTQQRMVDDVLMSSATTLQLFFEAHKVEMPSIAGKLSEIEGRHFGQGITAFVERAAQLLGYRYDFGQRQIKLYQTTLKDLTLSRNIGVSRLELKDQTPEIRALPRETLFPDGSPVVLRINVPLMVPKDDSPFAPASVKIASSD